jgi:RNase H-like domain found in reverse transcriptase/Reverse transcriptase (RNA-dependent DNA polymerase)
MNSLATFQTMMNSIFTQEIAEACLTIYMDDMAIHTYKQPGEDDQSHLTQYHQYVNRVLEKLQEHNLFLKPEKCTFEQSLIEFLGVKLEQGTVQMDDTKVEKARNWRHPNNITEVQKFLGFTGYYCYFIKDYLKLARPLLQLMHLSTPWHWDHNKQAAFETLRDAMCKKVVLHQLDFTKPFHLHTDALAYGVGAILSQEGELSPTITPTKPKLHPVAYYSATFTETEWNYNIYDQELLAIMKAIMHWWLYLIWTQTPFTIYTDHVNLLYWKSLRKLNRCTARWHSELQDYHFTIQHVPGKLHTAADSLSRPPSSDLGKYDNQDIQMLPDQAFQPMAIQLTNEDSDSSLAHRIVITQNKYAKLLNQEMTS